MKIDEKLEKYLDRKIEEKKPSPERLKKEVKNDIGGINKTLEFFEDMIDEKKAVEAYNKKTVKARFRDIEEAIERVKENIGKIYNLDLQ